MWYKCEQYHRCCCLAYGSPTSNLSTSLLANMSALISLAIFVLLLGLSKVKCELDLPRLLLQAVEKIAEDAGTTVDRFKWESVSCATKEDDSTLRSCETDPRGGLKLSIVILTALQVEGVTPAGSVKHTESLMVAQPMIHADRPSRIMQCSRI